MRPSEALDIMCMEKQANMKKPTLAKAMLASSVVGGIGGAINGAFQPIPKGPDGKPLRGPDGKKFSRVKNALRYGAAGATAGAATTASGYGMNRAMYGPPQTGAVLQTAPVPQTAAQNVAKVSVNNIK